MKLTVERKPFAELLKRAASVAKGIGILANVKLSCQAQISGGALDLEAASAAEACRLSLPVDGELREGGELLVEAERLAAFVNLDTAEKLTLTHAKNRLTVEGRSRVALSTLPADAFPALPDPSMVKDWLTLPEECLFQAFPRPRKLASDKRLRGCSSTLLTARGGLVRAYGNGAALVYRAGSVSDCPEELELALVIPREASRVMDLGCACYSGCEEKVILLGQAGGWLFAHGDQSWAFRQPEEQHPDYESLPVWNAERQPEAMLSAGQAKELLAGIKAMASVAELGHFWVGQERVGVMVQGDVQSGEWELEGVDTADTDLRWFGNLNLLAKGLSVVAEEGVGFELYDVGTVVGAAALRAKNALDEQVWIGGMKR